MTVYHAKGTKFERETQTPGTYAAIAQVLSIGGPVATRETLDATDMDDSWREVIAGLRDPGEVTLELLFDPDSQGHTDLRGDLAVDATHKYRITFPDTTPATCSFDGLVTRFEPRAALGDRLIASVAIKLSGAPTWA